MKLRTLVSRLFLTVIVLIVGVLLYALSKPSSFEVRRSISIAAPPERIMPMLVDFRRWIEWSPWEGLDPDMKRSYSGADTGVGEVYEWSGNDKAGAGRMKVTDATATHLAIDLDFTRPFETDDKTWFDLVPEGSGTRVDWTLQGPMPYLSKLMSVFVSMDAMVGPDFDSGLARLKAAAEH